VASRPGARRLAALAVAVVLVGCSSTAPGASSVPGPYGPAAAYARRRGSDVLLVQRNGRTVTTVYSSGWSEDRAHRLASGTKSFAGALGIAAAGAGLLSLDEPVADTITEWRSDAAKSRITVRELLDQSSGLDPNAGLPARDMYRAAIDAPLVAAPGTKFDYGPNHFGVFAALVQRKMRAAGLHGDPLGYLEEHVFRPIGLHVSGWDRDAVGQPLFAAGADLSARQWAKFGRLVAQHGRWDGRVVLEPQLVAEMLAPSPANSRYGLGWWLNPGPELEDHTPLAGVPSDLALAAGAGDQRLYVVASEGLVMVRFGEDEGFEDREFLACLFSSGPCRR
jgi:CubicO group peptidase (beta-lactamase class C family)